MALSTAVPTVTDQWSDGARLHVIGTIAIGASTLTYAAGGLICDLTLPGVIQSSEVPKEVKIEGLAGWIYHYVPGSTQANGKVKAMGQQPTSATGSIFALDEAAVAAVPATMSGDTITFHAIFRFGV